MNLKIALGSRNQIKYEAVKISIENDEYFRGSQIYMFDVDSEVGDQPITLDEIALGAYNRSVNAHKELRDASLSIGIESGIYELMNGKYIQTSICSIWDGHREYLAQCTGYEHSDDVLNEILRNNKTVEEAYRICGYTELEKLGASKGGAVGIVSGGRYSRKDFLVQAIDMSLAKFKHHRGIN